MSKDEIKDAIRAMLREVRELDRDEAFEAGFQAVKKLADQGANALLLFQALFELLIENDIQREVKLHPEDLDRFISEALEKHP